MVRYEDECVGCTEMGCVGSNCPNRNVKRFYCDCCGEEAEKLYITDKGQLCSECITDNLQEFFEVAD